MPVAFVLITAEIGADEKVFRSLKTIPEVKEAYMVYGVYDIVTRVEAETMQELKRVVSLKIRRLNKVRSTMTMIVME